jgi:hypothetical protein
MNKENLRNIFLNTAGTLTAAILAKKIQEQELERRFAAHVAATSAAAHANWMRETEPARSRFKALCDLIVVIGNESGAFSASNKKDEQNGSTFLRLQSGDKVLTIQQRIFSTERRGMTSELTVKEGQAAHRLLDWWLNHSVDRLLNRPNEDSFDKPQVVTSEEDVVKLVSTWAAKVAPEKMGRYTHSKSALAPAPKAP